MKISHLILLGLGIALVTTPIAHADIDHMQTPTYDDLHNTPKSPANDPLWLYSEDGKQLLQPLHNGNQVYYYISVPKSNRNYRLYQYAVKQWNRLGVIKLVQVSSPQQAGIQLTGEYHKYYDSYAQKHGIKEPDYAGNTSHQWVDVPDKPNVAYLKNVVVTLSPFDGADDDDDNDWLNYKLDYAPTAEHEIGHALGLNHDYEKSHGKYYIMNGNGAFFYGSHRLGQHEKQLLQKHYFPQS